MKIVELDNGESNEKLQRFVQKHKLLFMSDAWAKNYDSALFRRCMIVDKNSDVIGCFCYYLFRKALFRFLITPPFAPNIGLYYINPAASVVGKHSFDKDLLGLIAAFFAGIKVQHTDLSLPHTVSDTQPFTWQGYESRLRYTYLIDLGLAEEQLWDNLSSKKRQSLTRAEKDKVEVSEATDLKEVYTLVLQSLSRNNVNKNTDILKRILFSFAAPDNSFAFIARLKGKPLSATFCVMDGDTVIYLFGGFDAAEQHYGAGASCMWQSIMKARKMGRRWFDFEGSMSPGIERYFREFGGKLTHYPSIEKTSAGLSALMKLKGNKS